MTTELKTPDAVPNSWVDHMPDSVRPYLRLMRVDRPIGIWLLFIPCLWGLLVARPFGTDAGLFYVYSLLMLTGSFAMRSAGCIYNDIVDRDIDAKVERTANRPLAAGIVSLRSAWGLLIGLSLVGLAVLVQFNGVAILTGVASLILVAIYPFMKRITWWPQAWLGLTFNWGVLVGAAAISESIPLPAMLMYASGLFWTLGYDTIYAHQDREDDALVGVKSTARRLGSGTRKAVALFYTLTILLASAALLAAGAGIWTLLLAPAAAHFGWQVMQLDIDDGEKCLRLFKSNTQAGLLIAFACLAA